MVIDTSALLAILFDEPETLSFTGLMGRSESNLLSGVNYVEAFTVAASRGREQAVRDLEEILRAAGVNVVGVDPEQARLARDAYLRFGKGHHPARLNLGDCFAYALAKAMDQPLLFKGDDFARTDIAAA